MKNHRSTKTEFPARMALPLEKNCSTNWTDCRSASSNEIELWRIKSIKPDLECCSRDQSFICSRVRSSWWMTISGPSTKCLSWKSVTARLISTMVWTSRSRPLISRSSQSNIFFFFRFFYSEQKLKSREKKQSKMSPIFFLFLEQRKRLKVEENFEKRKFFRKKISILRCVSTIVFLLFRPRNSVRLRLNVDFDRILFLRRRASIVPVTRRKTNRTKHFTSKKNGLVLRVIVSLFLLDFFEGFPLVGFDRSRVDFRILLDDVST